MEEEELFALIEPMKKRGFADEDLGRALGICAKTVRDCYQKRNQPPVKVKKTDPLIEYIKELAKADLL